MIAERLWIEDPRHRGVDDPIDLAATGRKSVRAGSWWVMETRLGGRTMQPTTMLAALGATLAATFAATAPAHAAASSASIEDTVATLNLDGADDNETVSVAGDVLVHTSTGGDLASASDWDSGTDGNQTVPADGSITVVVNGAGGNDALSVLAKKTEVAGVTLNGDAGDDVLTGADSGDTIKGGEGNDRLVGAKGTDTMSGGDGNDTLVWNNGDGTDRMDGDAGNDGVEVNGAATAGDAFKLQVNGDRVRFRRTNLIEFSLDASAERFQVNGLGGDDSLSADPGVGALTQLSVDGGAGADDIAGSDGPNLIAGGEGNDVLAGGGGDDRIVGDRGADAMNGGVGDDTLVWNNGDGSDVAEGGDGRDDVEVNGAPGAGDAFTVQPNGSRIRFDRTNLVPFSIDIGTSESMHANGLGGDDTIGVGDVGSYAVTGSGGAGNDTLTGGGASETFLGGTGNDTITPGGGLDVVSGDEGDDHVDVRDATADVARGGAGDDSVVADGVALDIVEGFEHVDRPVVVTPPPVPAGTLPVTIKGGTVKVRKGKASIKVTAPAGSANSNGTLVLRTARRVKIGGLRVVLQLGSARYDIAPGTTKTVKVRLAKGSRRLAGRNGRLKARAFATTGSAGQLAESSKRVTLALGR
jgi:Ca2+-binding RTX toxin-like protein